MQEMCVYRNIRFERRRKTIDDPFDDNLFTIIHDTVQPFLDRPISLIHHDKDGFTCICFETKHAILQLLRKKQDKLFLQKKDRHTKFIFPKNKVIKIDTHTGDEKKETYLMYNNLIEIFPPEYYCFLDKKECDKEIKSIEKTIREKENATALLEGL